jgi:hypothetical protein
LPAGQAVRITGFDGSTLIVEPVALPGVAPAEG